MRHFINTVYLIKGGLALPDLAPIRRLWEQYCALSAQLGEAEDYDVALSPALADYGSVMLEAWGLAYEYRPTHFTLTNLTQAKRSVLVDLSLLYPDHKAEVWELAAGENCIERKYPLFHGYYNSEIPHRQMTGAY